METARSRVGEFLPLEADGYSCTSEQLTDVLLAVSCQKETIEQVCADLNIKVGAETIRGYFNEQLKVAKLSELQEAVNGALQKGVSDDLKKQKLEVAIDFHDQSYYGKATQAEGKWVGAEERKRDDAGVSGSDAVCHQKRKSVDALDQVCIARRDGEGDG